MKSIIIIVFSACVALVFGADCPDGTRRASCIVDPCLNAKCVLLPFATSVSDNCGGCNCRFYVGKHDVTDKCGCQKNQPVVQCLINPCDIANCPRFPGAIKVVNYCEDCHCDFIVGLRKLNNKCDCPVGKPLAQCFVDPCQVKTCPNFPDAFKVSDYCGGCTCRFYDGKREVTKICNKKFC